MIIRRATDKDTDASLEIYSSAREFMKENGNPDQWARAYPSRADIEEGLAAGTSFVAEEDGEVVAVFHFAKGPDPTYLNIFDGDWKNEDAYGVIHRIAVKHRGRGIARFIFEQCFKIIPNLKIDTHKNNLQMQRTLSKNGFKYCGIIYTSSGEERIAFQKSK